MKIEWVMWRLGSRNFYFSDPVLLALTDEQKFDDKQQQTN